MTPEQHRAAAQKADHDALTARTRAENRQHRNAARQHRLAALLATYRTENP